MSYTVNSMDIGKITLGEKDPVKSVLQNIAVILSTQQQSVPLYREFGLSMQFVDKPMPIAKALMTIEIEDAISKYEPRASVSNITFNEDISNPGRLNPIVEVEIDVE